ncbi:MULTISPECIES: hypothetical protein [Corallococcus]|uniref:hypothetical protein n=1 Tax=Corallococcus TaxID=83461 RepID=UPI00117E0593|nr:MULTISPECIES: hypothetical protein [Corallococcus]NBD13220.1 hypothetical protein [Corallococcus silvisoli]TSC23353.1 hypothetical protein FOF48_30085 [Corallococcus sp. Z5C101001]
MRVPDAGPPPRGAQATSVALGGALHRELQQEPITQPETHTRVRRGEGRLAAGERWIARMLRTGAVISGGLFIASLVLELLPRDESVHVAIDLLRKAAASMLLVTPVARLAMAGTLLGLRGEWRYAAIAAGVISLLAIAVGAGFQA